MTRISRRRFIGQLAAVSGLLLSRDLIFTRIAAAQQLSDFNILVAGDSFIWGQGLQEKDKFYTLVANWLEKEHFLGRRRVSLTVKAHSGAKLELTEKDLTALRRAKLSPKTRLHPEVDVFFPSSRMQIDEAGAEYRDPASVGLVMLSGGITDLVVGNTVNPFLRRGKLRRMIHTHSHAKLAALLQHTAELFPNAIVLVIGYFPIVSTKSDVKMLTRYLLKIIRFPAPLRHLLTNPASRQILKIGRKSLAEHSRIWVAESNREARDAIVDANRSIGRERVFFVESPITENEAFATKDSMLWGLGADAMPEDDLFGERRVICSQTFREIRYRSFGPFSTRLCELASVAHPNRKGSAAYAEEIKKILREKIASV